MNVVGEMDKDVFGAAADLKDGGTVEGFEFGWLLGGDGAWALDLGGVDDGVCGSVVETADDGIDFWEFWHWVPLLR